MTKIIALLITAITQLLSPSSQVSNVQSTDVLKSKEPSTQQMQQIFIQSEVRERLLEYISPLPSLTYTKQQKEQDTLGEEAHQEVTPMIKEHGKKNSKPCPNSHCIPSVPPTPTFTPLPTPHPVRPVKPIVTKVPTPFPTYILIPTVTLGPVDPNPCPSIPPYLVTEQTANTSKFIDPIICLH